MIPVVETVTSSEITKYYFVQKYHMNRKRDTFSLFSLRRSSGIIIFCCYDLKCSHYLFMFTRFPEIPSSNNTSTCISNDICNSPTFYPSSLNSLDVCTLSTKWQSFLPSLKEVLLFFLPWALSISICFLFLRLLRLTSSRWNEKVTN